MITRIELTNFMSHKHTVIEPARGLTVLVGPNTVGKSAIVAALQILCHNANSTYVMRHGERECLVRVETDDDHVIEWRRKTSPSYSVDGKQFDRLGRNGVPEEVCSALRLAKVDAGDNDNFDVHFGSQKSPIFLLADPSAAARFFASSSDAIRLVKVQRRHKEKLARAQQDKTRFEAESIEVNRDLALLEPAVEVSRRLEVIETTYENLLARARSLEQGNQIAAAMATQRRVVRRLATLAATLEPLPQPPQEIPTERISVLIGALGAAEVDIQRARNQAAALDSLAAPPSMHETVQVSQLVKEIIGIETKLAIAKRRCDVLDDTVAPPPPTDVCELTNTIDELCSAAEQLAKRKASAEAADIECSAAADELRRQAAGKQCPVCGVELDPDRFVAHALAGVGGHLHD